MHSTATAVLNLQGYQPDLNNFDQALLADWMQNPHATDFELGYWDGPYPEVHLPEIANLIQVTNQQPHGEMDVEDVTYTPELLQQMDEHMFAGGAERWMLYARHQQDGRLAGFTDVFWHPDRPTILKQDLTGVLPEYRGMALGKLLKAVMLQRILQERPQVGHIRTMNANANVPMLNINEAMGFRPYIAYTVWQIEADKLLNLQ